MKVSCCKSVLQYGILIHSTVLVQISHPSGTWWDDSGLWFNMSHHQCACCFVQTLPQRVKNKNLRTFFLFTKFKRRDLLKTNKRGTTCKIDGHCVKTGYLAKKMDRAVTTCLTMRKKIKEANIYLHSPTFHLLGKATQFRKGIWNVAWVSSFFF